MNTRLLWAVGAALLPAAALAAPTGTPLLAPNTTDPALLSAPGQDTASATVVPVTGQPFPQALHVEVKKAPVNSWDVQVIAPTTGPVQAGDTLLLSFYVRVISPIDGSAAIDAGFEKQGDPWTKSLDFNLTPPAVWKKIDLPFKSVESYPAGGAHAHILLGALPQTVEIGGMTVTDFGPNVDPKTLPHFELTYGGREADAPWRRAAQARIDKIRKGSLVVKVVGANGQPLPGAKVQIAQTESAFPFGTCVSQYHLLANGPDDDRYRQEVSTLFARLSPENELKWWPWYEPNQDRRAGIDLVRWGRERGKTLRGQCLIWPSWSQSPPPLKQGFNEARQAGGSDAARAWLERKIESHITEEVTALKGQVQEWDVINEPVGNYDLMDILGDGAMVKWFQAAHAADPQARLMINENGILHGQGPDTAIKTYHRTIKFLMDHGAPLGGIGIESHFDTALPSADQVLTSLDEYARFGIPLEVTEYDMKINDKQLQSDFTRDYLTLCFSHPAMSGFVFWGFWDGSHWLNDAPFYNKDWSLKPSGQAILDLMKQWRTDISGAADASGVYRTRAFLGTYRITAAANGRSQTATAEVAKSGDGVTVVTVRL